MHSSTSQLRTLLLALLLISFLPSNGQDIDRKKVDIVYIRLPLNMLPEDVATYHVDVKPATTRWGNSFGNVYDVEKIMLNGYYRLQDASDADLRIESELVNELIFEKAEERKAELTYKKDKNSLEIKYIAYYYYVTFYTPKIHYRISTKAGKSITDAFIGGVLTAFQYGSTDYSSYFSNSYALASAWRNDNNGLMAGRERDAYQLAMNGLQGYCLSYCMYPVKAEYSVRYVDEKRGRTVYQDLLQARDFYMEAVSTIRNDKIEMINKLVQPDYENRKETMKKAIDIWEKALAEADFDNKKARIDSRVGRHLYYNLALAYLWIDDFVKAKEYAQGRKKDLGSWDKNLLSGIRDLSTLIDDRAARQEANKWRPLLIADSDVYVYKDPATRKKDMEEARLAGLERMKAARADSLAKRKAKTGVAAKKTRPGLPAAAKKTVPQKTGTSPAAKSTALKSQE